MGKVPKKKLNISNFGNISILNSHVFLFNFELSLVILYCQEKRLEEEDEELIKSVVFHVCITILHFWLSLLLAPFSVGLFPYF